MKSTDRLGDAARWSLLGLVIAGALSLGACNTMEGAGKDIESAGDTIEDSARSTKRSM